MGSRFCCAVLVAALVAALLAGCAPASPVTRKTAPSVEPVALRILHHWDDARARAWSTGDERGLVALYVAGSRAGLADAALLRRYQARGLRVVGIRMQVSSVQVVVQRADELRLVVLERFAGAVVRSPSRTTTLPSGTPTRRLIELTMHAGTWLVSRVRQLPLPGPHGRHGRQT